MGLDLGNLVSTLAPMALGAIGSMAGGQQTGRANATGGGDADVATPALEAPAPRGGNGGSSNALGGIASLLKLVDLGDIAKLVNPNLPPEQDSFFRQADSYATSFLGGGGRANPVGGARDASKAGEYPGTPDEQLAQINARKAISQIDWSKPDIALWVPGTGNHGVDPAFAKTLGADTSVVAVDYPANMDFMGGVSTGMLTTKLVLEEIEKRGRTASLTGYSQGAWVAGEVMADPAAEKTVTRAVLYGHPKAANAQYPEGHAKVREVNNADDPYSNMGDDTTAIQGLSNLASGNIDGKSIAGLLSGLVSQPDIVNFLVTAGDPNVGKRHGYDLGSEAAWLKG